MCACMVLHDLAFAGLKCMPMQMLTMLWSRAYLGDGKEQSLDALKR